MFVILCMAKELLTMSTLLPAPLSPLPTILVPMKNFPLHCLEINFIKTMNFAKHSGKTWKEGNLRTRTVCDYSLLRTCYCAYRGLAVLLFTGQCRPQSEAGKIDSHFFEFKRTFVGSSSPDQASRIATPSVEREQTDQETPRTVPETQRDLVRRLLGEVSEMRKENQQLQSEVATLKANVTKRRLVRQPKYNDPECSVSYFFSSLL